MSVKNEEVIQSVTISGITVSTPTGVVLKSSNAEKALKRISAKCEKNEIIERARKISLVLVAEYENASYSPNIDYLFDCLRNRSNRIEIMNWLLGLASSNVRPPKECPDFIESAAEPFMSLFEEIVNGHS